MSFHHRSLQLYVNEASSGKDGTGRIQCLSQNNVFPIPFKEQVFGGRIGYTATMGKLLLLPIGTIEYSPVSGKYSQAISCVPISFMDEIFRTILIDCFFTCILFEDRRRGIVVDFIIVGIACSLYSFYQGNNDFLSHVSERK